MAGPRPGRVGTRSTGLGAVVLVLAVTIGVWLINGRDPGTSTAVPEGASSAASEAPADPATESSHPVATAEVEPSVDPDSGLPYVALADLPVEAGEIVDLIDRGGPFDYDKDGSTFGNFEGLLPDRERGHYAEYTVETPGSDDRGARRIIAGDRGELYWTADHYASFSRIRS